MFFVCSNPVRFFATDASYHSYLSRIGVMTFHALYNIEITNRPVVSKVIIMQSPCNTVMMDSFINIEVKDVIIYLSNSLPEVMNFPEVWRSVSAAANADDDDDDIYHPGQFHVVNQHQPQQQQQQQQQQQTESCSCSCSSSICTTTTTNITTAPIWRNNFDIECDW